MADEEAVREFVREYGKPYDPDTDAYDRPAFAVDIKEGKNDPIYNAHSYHTKVPPRGIIPYILHYTKPGDLILDPFCGSGMTGVAAQMCAHPPGDILAQFSELKDRVGPRRAILNDLSPAACHIAYNYTTPVSLEALANEFERVNAAVREQLDGLYRTEHYEPALGAYDPCNSEVSARLEPPHHDTERATLFENAANQTWKLVDRAEVERRLGYPVTDLPHRSDWGTLDLATVTAWLVIPATIQYTIWSDVYRCEGFITISQPTGKVSSRGANLGKPIVRRSKVSRGCGRPIVLWDVAVGRSGEVLPTFRCPNPSCQQEWSKTALKRLGTQPVVTNYTFLGLSSTGGAGRLRQRRFERRTSVEDLRHVDEIRERLLGVWVPSTEMDPKGPQYRRNALRSRSIKEARDFFTPRNLIAYALLWNEIRTCPLAPISDRLWFALTAICNTSTRMYAYRSSRKGGILKGSLYLPSFFQEMNVASAFKSSYRRIQKMTRNQRPWQNGCQTIEGSATDMPCLPDACVDYIYTDPPFGSNIYYSEASFIWESWLNRFMDRALEAVVHRVQDGGTKRITDYAALIDRAFREMFRVLKPGRWVTVEFNNRDGAVFEVIKSAAVSTGFSIENMLILDKRHKTFKQHKGVIGLEDVVDKDVVFNLHKPAALSADASGLDADLESEIVLAVREHLQSLPDRIRSGPEQYGDDRRTTATLNSVVVRRLLPRGIAVKRLSLQLIERVCARYFRKIGQSWYLRGEAVGREANGLFGGEEVSVADEASAIAWIRQRLLQGPAFLGELKPLWMRATGLLPAKLSDGLVLEDLLSENFWRDLDTNRWREPTDEERERMNNDRSIRALHDAERYVAHTLRRESTDAERCEWIDVLFRTCRAIEDREPDSLAALRGFDVSLAYRLIGPLFTSVLGDHVDPSIYAIAEKQARAAAGRGKVQVAEETSGRRSSGASDRERSLFD